MYRIGKNYKLELPNKIFYTGEIIEEDLNNIRVRTIRNEELILNKNSIVQAKELNWIGGGDGKSY